MGTYVLGQLSSIAGSRSQSLYAFRKLSCLDSLHPVCKDVLHKASHRQVCFMLETLSSNPDRLIDIAAANAGKGGPANLPRLGQASALHGIVL